MVLNVCSLLQTRTTGITSSSKACAARLAKNALVQKAGLGNEFSKRDVNSSTDSGID